MPHNVLEGTDHTTFRGWYAGKAGKDAHPARAGATILTSVLPHDRIRQRLQDRSSEAGSREVQPAGRDAHGKVCKGEGDIEHTGVLLYSPVACPYVFEAALHDKEGMLYL